MDQQQQQQQQRPPSKPAGELPQKPGPHNGCADVKPRLTKDQHDILEAHFQQQHKPSTNTKKGFADALGVPLDKINNWFQNRRAKVKQDARKQQNQMQMSMSMYATAAQMPIVAHQYPPHTEQQQPPPMTQDYYSVGSDMGSAHFPVESIENQVDPLSSQAALHQAFDMHQHQLRTIPEANRSASYNQESVMRSLMAAAEGPSYMQSNGTSLAPQDSAFSYGPSGLPQSFPGDMSFSLPNETTAANDFSNGFGGLPGGFDYSSLTRTATADSAAAQDSAGPSSSEPSPFSGAPPTATTQATGAPAASSVSIASVFSNWNGGVSTTSMAPVNEIGDSFGQPSLPHTGPVEHGLPFWASDAHSTSQGDLYQLQNASVSGILSSPGQDHSRKLSSNSDLEPPPPITDDIYQRRNSSTSTLANTIEGIHIQSQTPDNFKHPSQASGLASRRHKRPAALNSGTLRSSSYSSGMPSPNGNPSDHALRRIRSSGLNNVAGRIQKPNPGSAQRSPLNLTFADAAASPKFSRTFSPSSNAALGQGGSLAPPTPLTPSEPARYPYWQSNTLIKTHPPAPEHSSPESLHVNWTAEPQSAGLYSHNASPPSTPLDLGQITQQQHIPNDAMYRDTPPQSAPATQPGFPPTAFAPPSHMNVGFRSTSDLTLMQPKPSHFRRPSLPDTNNSQFIGSHVQFPVQLNGEYSMPFDQQFQGLNGMAHKTRLSQSGPVPEFFVHQYSPPQGAGQPLSGQPAERRNYVFANQGPHDFR